MTNRHNVVDSSKRNALKLIVSSTGAASSLASMPSIANTSDPQSMTKHKRSQRPEIEATLVSIPGSTNETLLLKNTTTSPVTISRFVQAKVAFDNETIDISAAFNNTTLVLPAHEDVMIHFSSQATPAPQSDADAALNVQAAVSRLPEGTRVIPIRAKMNGTSAVLQHA